MTTIDCHNHLGVDLGAGLSQTADELLARLEQAGIERAVVFPFPGAPDLAAGNDTVAEASAAHPDRLIPFYCVNPREHRGRSTDELVGWLGALRARGVIIDPAMHHFSVRHALVDPLLEACARLGLPLVVELAGHGRDDCSPFVSLAARHPAVTVIVTSLIYCPGWAVLTKDQPNLYADTVKALHPRHIRQLVETLGAERVLFGTETPYLAPIVERAKLTYTELPDDVIARVSHRNIARLLDQQVA
jgi:predicted TIM-barrel fold metal-dependent hydrolase